MYGPSYITFFIPRPSLGAGFLPPQDPAQILLQRRQKGLVAQWAPSVLVGAKEFQVLFPDHPGEKATPVRGQLEQGSNLHQCVVPPAHMCPGAAPGIAARRIDQPGADWVELHVPCRGQQVGLVEHERGKAPLPEMTTPSLAKVDHPCVATVRLADGPSQAN